jgi:ribosomal protein L7/L12
MEEILGFLRIQNASKIDSIRLLHLGTGIGLGEAKRLVFLSATWQDRLKQDEAFLESIMENLEKLEKSGQLDRTAAA